MCGVAGICSIVLQIHSPPINAWPLPKEPDLRDCPSRDLLATGFQYKTSTEEGRVRREDNRVGVGYNLPSKVPASLKAACSTFGSFSW